MDYGYLRGNDGTGPAVLAHVDATRSIGATTLVVDDVGNWPDKFICTTGELLPSGLLDPDTITEFYGHLSGGDIIIDAFVDGYADIGNTTSDVAIIKPTGEFANRVADLAEVEHNEDGTHKEISTPAIHDTNDNEVLTFAAVALAVNYLKLTNSIAGAGPILEALGDDTDVSFRLKAKGAGTVQSGRPIAFRMTTTKSYADGGSGLITGTEVFDYGNNFVHTTGIFTAPYAGIYHFDLVAGFDNSPTTSGRIDTTIQKNGATVAHGHGWGGATNADPNANISLTIELAAGDTIAADLSNNMGGTEALTNSSFSGFLVGRTD